MKTRIPAVFFQKRLKGSSTAAVQVPEKLEMFENELAEVVGGLRANVGTAAIGARRVGDGSGGTTTYSYSAGWLDVEQADDCAA